MISCASKGRSSRRCARCKRAPSRLNEVCVVGHDQSCRALVRAALRAAAERAAGPLVAAALRADFDRSSGERFLAADRACFESEAFDAAARPSFLRASLLACERFLAGRLLGLSPSFRSRSARSRVALEAVPFLGGANLTPPLLAFERPIAMACFVERAPCLPSRT